MRPGRSLACSIWSGFATQRACLATATGTGTGVWTPESKRTGVIGIKIGMTGLWDEWGVRHPVTVLKMEDVQVVQARPSEHEPGMVQLQTGAVNQLPQRVPKPMLGHFSKAGVSPKKRLHSFQVTEDAQLPVGTVLDASHFVPGQYVDVQAPR
ncbi:translation protein [Syncephalis pseudoplumigaleata]|uniref:Translation protein n=1 Tax=Syncephalis pseudoplumigaleata TaxID=1712513 RepID=A0A4P9YRI7_9FUNG|nr:translation protein [Syncephalis pseudoplumigaleata]|eukprot:RKP22437.1 translation protein [Syncephalis pseudoplumigaleata]